MDGWAVLTALKADPALADIPVIFLTMVDEKNLGYAMGAADFLVKPVQKETLLKAVARHASAGTVLIVEDDAPTRELLRTMLHAADLRTAEAENGQEALDWMEQEQPALLVLDLMMPVMDGFTVIERMRARQEWASIPVIVCTAKDVTEDDRRRPRRRRRSDHRQGPRPARDPRGGDRGMPPATRRAECCGLVHFQPPWTCGRFGSVINFHPECALVPPLALALSVPTQLRSVLCASRCPPLR